MSVKIGRRQYATVITSIKINIIASGRNGNARTPWLRLIILSTISTSSTSIRGKAKAPMRAAIDFISLFTISRRRTAYWTDTSSRLRKIKATKSDATARSTSNVKRPYCTPGSSSILPGWWMRTASMTKNAKYRIIMSNGRVATRNTSVLGYRMHKLANARQKTGHSVLLVQISRLDDGSMRVSDEYKATIKGKTVYPHRETR